MNLIECHAHCTFQTVHVQHKYLHSSNCVSYILEERTTKQCDLNMTSDDNKPDETSVQRVKKDVETGKDVQLEKETFFKKFGGMLMALAASFFFSVSFLIVKILSSHGFKAFGCSVLFNLGVLVPCLIGILWHEKGPKAHERCSLFKEIWPLNISNNNTTFKLLVVSVMPLHF